MRDASLKPSAPPWGWREIWVLAGLILLAFALRLCRASAKGIMVDELSTYNDCLAPMRPDFWRDYHFIAFMLFRAALFLGHSDFILRLPSIVLSALAVPAIYVAQRRWFNDRSLALLGALLMAVSFTQLRLAHEARYYGMATFASSLSLYYLHRLLFQPGWRAFIAFILINVFNYGLHPSTVVFFGTQSVFLVGWMVLRSAAWRRPAGVRSIVSSPKRLALSAAYCLLACGLVWTIYKYLIVFQIERAQGLIVDFRNPVFTERVSFSTYFFMSPIRDFVLLSFPRYDLTRHAILVYNCLFFTGLGYGLFRRRWQTLFVVFAYGVTYAFLFAFKWDIPFTSKYIIYLYPLYLFVVCLGAAFWAKAALYPFRRRADGTNVLPAAIAILVLLQAAQFRNYFNFYRYDFNPFRTVMETVGAEAGKDDLFLTNTTGHYYFEHYRRMAGIEEERFFYQSLGSLKHFMLMRRGKGLWFAPFHHTFGSYDEEALARVAGQFDWHSVAQSWVADHYNLTLYRKDCARLLFPGQCKKLPLTIDLDGGQTESSQPAFVFRRQKGCFYTSELDLASMGEARIKLVFPAEIANIPGLSAGVESDAGRKELEIERLANGLAQSKAFPVSEGRLTVNLALQNPGRLAFEGREIQLWTESGRIGAWHCSDISERWRHGSLTIEGQEALAFFENGRVSYPIHAEQDGPKQFYLDASHDKPGPVRVEVAVNGWPSGVLSLEQGDGQFRLTPFVATLRKGRNDIQLTFLSPGQPENTYAIKKPSGGNTEFVLRGLTFGPFSKNESKSAFWPPDKFLSVPKNQNLIVFSSDAEGRELSSLWLLKGDGTMRLSKKGRQIELMPRENDGGVALVCRPFSIQDDRCVYWSFLIKTGNLHSQSANSQVIFYDSARQAIKGEWGLDPGITGESEWLRLSCLKMPPKGAKYASIVFAIYPNSKIKDFLPGSALVSSVVLNPHQVK